MLYSIYARKTPLYSILLSDFHTHLHRCSTRLERTLQRVQGFSCLEEKEAVGLLHKAAQLQTKLDENSKN